MSFLFLSMFCADSHSTLGRISCENVGEPSAQKAKCESSGFQISTTCFFQLLSFLCLPNIHQFPIIFSYSVQYRPAFRELCVSGEEMSKEMLDPGRRGTSLIICGKRGRAREFHRGGGPRSPYGTVPALLGTQPLDQDLGYSCLGND